ncbi:MAG: UDP-N-acetylglucosamine 1-carboxyvinyltransferase [Treponemataceae bacterium]
MYEYHIEGSFPIKGTVRASGNKNAALPCIAAVLLTKEKVILRNIPDIEDTGVMIKILEGMGVKALKIAENAWEFDPSEKINPDVPADMAKKIRASILFAGPLLARCGKANIASPGGDVIGRRRIDTHLLVLEGLGARIDTAGHLLFTANKLVGDDIFLDEASVTATENAVMAACLAEGQTILTNTASEPHVRDLCNLLNSMGADISGSGSNCVKINGVKELHGTDFTIGPDYMEIGSFIGLAAATHGSIRIEGVDQRDMRCIKLGFARLGITWQVDENAIIVDSGQNMEVVPDLGGMIPKIDDAPWPGFPPDLTSIMTVVATQVNGTVMIHEKMFESRMFFVDKLIGMGARIVLCDPHRAVVSGPTPLHGTELVSPDVRAGMAMVIAAMSARGESRIKNVYQVERGYEHLTEKLQSLGAHIERITM